MLTQRTHCMYDSHPASANPCSKYGVLLNLEDFALDIRAVEEKMRHDERVRLREEKSRPRRILSTVFFGIVLFFVLGIAVAFLFLRSATTSTGALARVASYVLGRNVSFDNSAPAVVNRIQSLNKLETVTYSIDAVVEGKHDNPVLPDLLFGDRLLLVAHGQAIAGVDMSKLLPESVHVNGRSVSIDLPQSEIFSTHLDSAKTHVYARTTGMLVQQDTSLEGDTRKQAEAQIQKAALDDGILDTARANARANITALLYGLGFQDVTVR